MGLLLLAIYLILLGLTQAAIVAISGVFLGVLAIITGIILLVESGRPYYDRWNR